jgi:hypothetical protein
MLYGNKPKLFGVRVLGSLTYVLIPKEVRPKTDKFDPRALKGYLVGFEASNIYRVWIPATDRVVRTRDVKIDESKRYEPPIPASIKLSAQEKEEMKKIQDLVDILHTTDHDWIEDLEMIPAPLKPQKNSQQQKPDVAAQLMTPPATPEYPNKANPPKRIKIKDKLRLKRSLHP